MDKAADREAGRTGMHPTGGIPMSEERLKLLAPRWEAAFRALRGMDELPLGDTEPATVFAWEAES